MFVYKFTIEQVSSSAHIHDCDVKHHARLVELLDCRCVYLSCAVGATSASLYLPLSHTVTCSFLFVQCTARLGR